MTSSLLQAGPFVMPAPLSLDDRALLAALEARVDKYKQINRLLRAYYEGNMWLNKIGFSVPLRMSLLLNIIGME